MTSFVNGPAKGQTLMLKCTPRFLRVTEFGVGIWDALDAPGDTPLPKEKLYAYELKEHLGNVHLNRGGGHGGFYPIATYTFIVEQPSDEEMRDSERWGRWCEGRTK